MIKFSNYIALLFAVLFLTATAAKAQENTISIPARNIPAGMTVTIPVEMSCSSDIVGTQFTLVLPEGLTADPSSARLNAERADGHAMRMALMPGTSPGKKEYLCLITSMQNKPLKGSTGILMTVDVTADKNIENGTVMSPSLDNVVLAAANGVNMLTSVNVGNITVHEKPSLTLSADDDYVTEGDILHLTLTASYAPTEDLTVNIICDKPSYFTVPASITLPAGQLTTVIDIPTVDDDIQDLSKVVTFTATASGHNQGSYIITRRDNDLPDLELTLTPDIVSESAGIMSVMGTLRRTSNIDKRVVINLSDDSNGALYYNTKSLTMMPGVSTMSFSMGPIDNAIVNGEKTYNVTAAVYVSSCSCNATAGDGSGSVQATLTVNDDDGAALGVVTSTGVVREGESFSITVSRNTEDTSTALPFTLSNDHDPLFTYDGNGTIPAGEKSVMVSITAKTNEIEDDSYTVTFTAATPGFSSAACYIVLSDQTFADATPIDITLDNSSIEAGDEVNVSIKIGNIGVIALPDATPVTVYVTGNGANIKTTLYTSEKTAVNSYSTVSGKLTIPTAIGTYSVTAIVNEAQRIHELSYINNTSATIPLRINSPFSATLSADKSVYEPGETVTLSGTVTGSRKANAQVEIYVINKEVRQTITATTDADGKFTAVFTPEEWLTGDFIAGACYPGEGLTTAMTSFYIYGMTTEGGYITIDIKSGETFNGGLTLKNTGSRPLTNVKVNILSKPDCDITFTDGADIPGNGSISIPFSVSGTTPTEGTAWELIKISITTDEGVTFPKTLYYYCRPQKATLKASISEINTSVVKGSTRDITFTVANNGYGETGEITLALPSFIRQTATIPSLGYGEKATVALTISTNENMQLNKPVTGRIAINCTNASGITIPYSVEAVSNVNGTVIIDVKDENTFFTDEKPHVKGATVIIKHPVTAEVLKTGITTEDGTFTFTLPEGFYSITVSESKHSTYNGIVSVDPDRTKTFPVFINAETVHYDWKVEETTVEDEYEIVTEVEYDTKVPAPILVVDFPKLPYKNHIAYVSITNKGLVEAVNVRVAAPEDTEWMKFEFLGQHDFERVLPQTSVIVPMRVTVDEEGAFEDPQMTLSSYSFTGTAAGGSSASASAKSGIPGTKAFTRPGCFKGTMKVTRDVAKCDPVTGHQYYDGTTEEIDAVYYYGNCGRPSIGGGTGPGVGPGGGYVGPTFPGGSGPGVGPYIPSDDKPGGSEILDRITEILMTGCLNDCEKALANAIKACYDAVKSCMPSPDPWDPNDCVDPILDCLEKEEVDADCVLGVGGCMPGPVGCGFNIANCLKSVYDAYEQCKKTKEARENGAKATGKPKASAADSKIVNDDTSDRLGVMLAVDSIAYANLRNLLGDDCWNDVSGAQLSRVQEYIIDNKKADGTVALIASRFDYKPVNISQEQFDAFLERYNNTVRHTKDDTFTADNMMDFTAYSKNAEHIRSYNAFAVEQGYDNLAEMMEYARTYRDELKDTDVPKSSSICASITLKFTQTMTLTRQAFRGTLTVYNGNKEKEMTDVKLNLKIWDENGNYATDSEFQINAETLNGFGGELSLTSGWTLAADGTGVATVLFIPTKNAAPVTDKLYSFGGSISYVDPFSGLEVTRELTPITLTVKPCPELDMHYFMQRDIIGDDPLTAEVEPCEEGEFSLLLVNKGFGEATNVRMVTNQPEITDNERGLLIDFEIMSSQLNGKEKTLAFGQSVTTEFGNIPAQSSTYAQWWLKSSLLGHFTDYDIHATHLTSYGNENLTLLDQVDIHELIRSLHDRDGKIAFLVNETADLNDTPDMLFRHDGSTTDVVPASVSIGEWSTVDNKLTIELTAAPSLTGWNYGNALIASMPANAKIATVTRKSDGSEVSLRNVWHTFVTLRDGEDPLYEDRIHIADDFLALTPETYVITLTDAPLTTLAVESIDGVPESLTEEPLEQLTVTFNKEIDPATFTTEDLTLLLQAEKQDVSLIGISTLDNKTFTLDLTAFNAQHAKTGYYVLTVQTAEITDAEGFKGAKGKSVGWTVVMHKVEPRDLNGDGKIDEGDLNDLRDYILQRQPSAGFDPNVADLNEDGRINVLDLQMLQNYLSRETPPTPVDPTEDKEKLPEGDEEDGWELGAKSLKLK